MNGNNNDFQQLNKELNDELLRCYQGEKTGFSCYGPRKYFFPSTFEKNSEQYFNFKTRSDDVWIVTFPRSGTTLTQELVWLLTHNLDYKTAKEKNLWERSPFFEVDILFHPETTQKFLNENIGNIENQNIIKAIAKPVYTKLNEMQSPRVIKTHFPLSMLPRDIKQTKPKIVYVARNPKDIAVSYYYLVRQWRTSDYQGDFETYLSQFENGLVLWGPFWEHIKESWDRKADDQIIFLFYEDMIKNMKGTIHKLAKFLSVNLTEKDAEILADHINIKNFKNNPAVNFEHLKDVGVLYKGGESFIRQGSSRGSGGEFSEESLARIEKWIQENSKKLNLQFPKK